MDVRKKLVVSKKTTVIRQSRVLKDKLHLTQRSGADERGPSAMTSLTVADNSNQCYTAHTLIEAGSDIHNENEHGNEAIHLAAMNGNVKIVKDLLESDANKNATGDEGRTPLLLAAQNNHCETAKVLIEAGCDIRSKDEDGDEAIHLAAISGNVKMVKLLLKSNASKNAKGDEGRTPLILAAQNNHCETAKVLIEAGCDIHSKNEHGNEAIHLAAMRGNVKMVKLLLESNASKNATGDEGRTPLILAAQYNYCETEKVLIEAGCDIHSKDEHGNEAIHFAAMNGNVKIVKVLLESNANKNATGDEGRTPLILAAQNNHCETAKVLIEAGCDIHSKDEYGKQAYYHAVEQGSKECVDILQTWNFEIQNEEMYLTNGNMSSMMELYIPKGALPSGSTTVMKATIRQKCNQNPGTQDQEGQFGPTISLLPHGTAFARPILALIRLPYEDLLNAEEFEFIVLHSVTEDDAPKEWVDITEFQEGETSGLVVPEHNVSMVVLFHFSFFTWFRRRRTKRLQVLVFTSLESEMLTVTCRFYPADVKNDKGDNSDCKGTAIFRPPLVITSEDSPIDVYIKDISEAWKILSLRDQQVNHDLVWRTKRFLELQFVFEMGDNPSRFVCTIVAQQKKEKSSCTVILDSDLLGSRSKKASEASDSKLGQDMEKPKLQSCSEHAACDSSHLDNEEPNASGSESTMEMSLPTDYQSCYSDEENEHIHAQHNRRIPDAILETVHQNRIVLSKLIDMGTVLMNHLKCKKVFTADQIENIQIEDGLNTKQAIMVLDMLPRISFHRYLMFRDCLTATNQEHVCTYLPTRVGTASA